MHWDKKYIENKEFRWIKFEMINQIGTKRFLKSMFIEKKIQY